jgi:septal ring factor EnvC (AmiA/AmiB activator)
MQGMAHETKVVKGGFRATLALIISIIAIIFAIMAYQSTGKDAAFNQRIKDLQATIEAMKQETSKKRASRKKPRNKTDGCNSRINALRKHLSRLKGGGAP